VIISVIVLIVASASIGCVNFLENDVESILPHVSAPYVRPPIEQIVVSDYDELVAAMNGLIMELESSAQLHYYSYNGENVQEEVQRACDAITNDDPIGAYAVTEITANTTRIVSYYEIEIEIEYKRTKEQLDSIISVSTQRYLVTQLLNIMSEYREEAVIRTTLQITEEDITKHVKEIYYQNPRRIVMLPVVAVEIYPEEGTDRIYEIRFGYTESPVLFQRYGENLALYIRRNAFLAVGDTDAEILLSLVNNLIASAGFDAGTARTISMHGAQNFAATAYGALVNGSAVGEGFAMAFKALCDELGFDCRIVLGTLDGRVHAWNIVYIDGDYYDVAGDYYHIDVAMCDVNGVETAFLKADADFEEMYAWERDGTVSCSGTLTYEDIVGTEEPDDPGEIEDEPSDTNNGTEDIPPDPPPGEPDEPQEPDDEPPPEPHEIDTT